MTTLRGLLRMIIDEELSQAATRIEARFLEAMGGGGVAASPAALPAPRSGLPDAVLARIPVKLRGDAETRIYGLLRGGEALTAGEVKERLGNLSRQMITKACKRLVDAGAIDALGSPAKPRYRVRG